MAAVRGVCGAAQGGGWGGKVQPDGNARAVNFAQYMPRIIDDALVTAALQFDVVLRLMRNEWNAAT